MTVFNASGLLPSALEAEIRAGIDDGVAALRRRTAVEGVGIAVLLGETVDDDTGLGGRAYGPDACVLWVDETSPALLRDLRRNVASTVVHELHHVLRMRQGFPRKFTDMCAGDILVLEGLATRCQIDLGYPEPSIVSDISDAQIAPLLDRIAPIVADAKADWMWIYRPSGLPARVYKAAYPMGHHVVGRSLARTGLTPIEAVGLPWREVWDAGRDDAA